MGTVSIMPNTTPPTIYCTAMSRRDNTFFLEDPFCFDEKHQPWELATYLYETSFADKKNKPNLKLYEQRRGYFFGVATTAESATQFLKDVVILTPNLKTDTYRRYQVHDLLIFKSITTTMEEMTLQAIIKKNSPNGIKLWKIKFENWKKLEHGPCDHDFCGCTLTTPTEIISYNQFFYPILTIKRKQ